MNRYSCAGGRHRRARRRRARGSNRCRDGWCRRFRHRAQSLELVERRPADVGALVPALLRRHLVRDRARDQHLLEHAHALPRQLAHADLHAGRVEAIVARRPRGEDDALADQRALTVGEIDREQRVESLGARFGRRDEDRHFVAEAMKPRDELFDRHALRLDAQAPCDSAHRFVRDTHPTSCRTKTIVEGGDHARVDANRAATSPATHFELTHAYSGRPVGQRLTTACGSARRAGPSPRPRSRRRRSCGPRSRPPAGAAGRRRRGGSARRASLPARPAR